MHIKVNQLSERIIHVAALTVSALALWATSGFIITAGEAEPTEYSHILKNRPLPVKSITQQPVVNEKSTNEKISQNKTVSLAIIPQPHYSEVNFAGKTFYKYSADTVERYYQFKDGQVSAVYEPLHNVITTAYTWIDGIGDPLCPDPKKTQTGTNAQTTYGIAADYKYLKPGTVLIVPGYGEHKVDDKCGRARQVGRGDNAALSKLGVDWRDRDTTRILIDLRIPNLGSNGNWRSDQTILSVAMNHGVEKYVTVLKRIWSIDD